MVWGHKPIITSLGRLGRVDHTLKDGSSYNNKTCRKQGNYVETGLSLFHFHPNSQTGSFSRAAHMLCQCLSAGGARKAQAGQQTDEKAK